MGEHDEASGEGEILDATFVDDDPSGYVAAAAPIGGRLATMTVASLLASAAPVPFLPDRALRHIRGAIAHETTSRHGLILSMDARMWLANPSSRDRVREALRKGVEVLSRRLLRRLGPLGPLGAFARAFEVYALGALLDRYLNRLRPTEGAPRILEEEARLLRSAIDTAVVRTLYPSTKATPLMLPEAAEDMRDEFTRWIDTFVLGAATVPSYVERRLEAAFDDVVAGMPELARSGR